MNLRKILQDISNTGMNHFTVQVVNLPSHMQELRIILALEPFDMLILNPLNNTLYVAGGSPNGMAVANRNRELLGESIYMYMNNVLVYVFDAIHSEPNSLNQVLGIRQASGFLDSDTLLYNTFFVHLWITKKLEHCLLTDY